MLIGICGGICSGKSTVAQYLVEHHGFTKLHLRKESSNGTDGVKIKNEEENSLSLGKPVQYGSSPPDQHTFDTPEDLLDFVTKRWRQRWVTTSIHNESILDVLIHRPFFILISVDAPVSTRWKRYQSRLPQPENEIGDDAKSLEDFLHLSDKHLYDPISGLMPLISRATIRLLNTSSNLAHLYATLGKLDLTNEDRLRPSWDQYFMTLATLASHRSNCMKRRVGCVLIRDHRVISTGYNGTPRNLKNCNAGGCPRCNQTTTPPSPSLSLSLSPTTSSPSPPITTATNRTGQSLETCLCIHAEENALLEAGRERIGENKSCILYCDTCPCLTCSIKIVQVGIGEVVFGRGYAMDEETAGVFREAGVRLRKFEPPANGMIHLENHALGLAK